MQSFIVLCIALAVLLVLQLTIDQRRSRLNRTFRYDIKSSEQGTTVVVELTKDPESLLPMLEHLSRQQMVEVLVIVKPSAGNSAVRDVKFMAKQYANMKVRVVLHKRGLTRQHITRYYSHMPFIVWLKPEQRLMHDFSAVAAKHFYNPAIQAIAASSFVPVERGVADALGAWTTTRRETIRVLFGRISKQQTVVYRRTAVYKKKSLKAQSSVLLRISTTPVAQSGLTSLAYVLVSALVVIALVGASSYHYGLILVIIASFIALLNLLWLVSAPWYSLRDRAVLVFVLPFSIAKV